MSFLPNFAPQSTKRVINRKNTQDPNNICTKFFCLLFVFIMLSFVFNSLISASSLAIFFEPFVQIHGRVGMLVHQSNKKNHIDKAAKHEMEQTINLTRNTTNYQITNFYTPDTSGKSKIAFQKSKVSKMNA